MLLTKTELETINEELEIERSRREALRKELNNECGRTRTLQASLEDKIRRLENFQKQLTNERRDHLATQNVLDEFRAAQNEKINQANESIQKQHDELIATLKTVGLQARYLASVSQCR